MTICGTPFVKIPGTTLEDQNLGKVRFFLKPIFIFSLPIIIFLRKFLEMTITVESEENKNIEDKLHVPNQPSSYLLNFLYTLCNEIHRIGGHVVDKVTLP